MRHGDKINPLGRTVAHKRALLSNLAIALITHKRIQTTLAKAKVLRHYVEPLITKAKDNTTHSRRVVFSYLQNKEAVTELFGAIATQVGDRPGGYVRVIRTGYRKGDGAETALIELVDFNSDYSGTAKPEGKETKRKKTRRRGGKGAATAVASTEINDDNVVVEEVEDAVEEIEEVENVAEEVEEVAEEQVDETSEETDETESKEEK
jgi:large subunit ribosomal protein L17